MEDNYLNSNIKILREEARLSIDELSIQTGILPERLEELELDASTLTRGEMKKLLPVLRISEDDFLSRNLKEERRVANEQMKHGDARKTLNWYYGSRKRMMFYIIAVAVMLVGAVVTFFAANSYLKLIDWSQVSADEIPWIINYWYIVFPYLGAAIPGTVFLVIEVFKKYHIRFRYWFIFIFASFYTVIMCIGAIMLIPFFIYCLYMIIFKHGKN